ncbi:hypothetical protein UFVDC4_00116 [Staphylococcus phage vB_SauM-UFV_DC4]|nr:hypothetical protein UFVDC4_00116 [Staphylococcus phage vB_SauM-UFV_DC4]
MSNKNEDKIEMSENINNEKVNKIGMRMKKFNRIMNSNRTFIFSVIACLLLTSYFVYSFIDNKPRNSSAPSSNAEQQYTTKNDEKAMFLIQETTNNKIGMLSEIDSILYRDDLTKKEKLDFLRDIKVLIEQNNKNFNHEINKFDTLSKDAVEDIKSMNKINAISGKYVDDTINFNKAPKDEKIKYSREIFQNNSNFRSILASMNYTNYDDEQRRMESIKEGRSENLKDKNNESNDK